MVTDPETIALLEKLAAERSITVEALIAQMAHHLDQETHTVWYATDRIIIRTKCGREKCFEKRERPTDNIRD